MTVQSKYSVGLFTVLHHDLAAHLIACPDVSDDVT